MSDTNSTRSTSDSQSLTPDEQQFVNAMRNAQADYTPVQMNEINRLIDIIDKLQMANLKEGEIEDGWTKCVVCQRFSIDPETGRCVNWDVYPDHHDAWYGDDDVTPPAAAAPAPQRRTIVITKDDLKAEMDNIDATIDRELAAQGLRRARQGDGEPGWYVLTSAGNVWATDLPASEKPAALGGER